MRPGAESLISNMSASVPKPEAPAIMLDVVYLAHVIQERHLCLSWLRAAGAKGFLHAICNESTVYIAASHDEITLVLPMIR